MKKSRIIALSGIGALVLMVVIAFSYIKIGWGNDAFVLSQGDVELSGKDVVQSYDFEGFSGLEVNSNWEVKVSQGSVFSVKVEADEAVMDRVSVKNVGDTLILGTLVSSSSMSNVQLKAEITMPVMTAVDVSGFADFKVFDMSMDRLDIDAKGTVNFVGKGLDIQMLEVNISGAGNLDLRDSDVYSCRVDIAGAANGVIHMTGGGISGNIAGLSNLEITGEVGSNRINSAGLARIKLP